MGDKFYILSEKSLKELLYNSIKLIALENGGVNNWEWYSTSIKDFCEQYVEENPELANINNISLKVIAEADLIDYYTVNELINEVLNETLASKLNH